MNIWTRDHCYRTKQIRTFFKKSLFSLIGIFLGYSLLQLLEYGIAWINRIEMYWKKRGLMQLQTTESPFSEKDGNDLDTCSCTLDPGNESDSLQTIAIIK